MAINLQGMLYDGTTSLDSGMDSGIPPNRIDRNQIAWGVNTTVRGGYITQRPAFLKRTLQFLDASGSEDATVKSNFETTRFQGASYYRQGERGFIMVMCGGRLFRIDPVDDYKVIDVTITDDPNPAERWRVWMVQAEDWLIVQDGQSAALIYDGGSARRAGKDEVPMGSAMAYGMGRLIVARGREYYAGDLVYSDTGTPGYGFRDAVLKFTETQYLSDGGSFTLPLQSGEITGMQFLANINTSLGQGELAVLSRDAVFTTSLPFDRTTWSSTPGLQRIAQINNGSVGDGMVVVNGDLFYRAKDGIRSLIMAVREFGQWSNRPVSREVQRALKFDSDHLLLHQSGVLFDNRLLMTVGPTLSEKYVYHTGLVALDFDVLSSMRGSAPPAYDGIWTGLNAVKLVTGQFGEEERCFALHYDTTAQVLELWEITKDGKFDNDGTERITWRLETRSFDFERPMNMKKLMTGELWVDDVTDSVDFDVRYRPDQYPFWSSWHTWTECATVERCDPDPGECLEFEKLHPQYRSRMGLPQPAYSCNIPVDRPMSIGWEFQLRVEIDGPCRIRQLRLAAEEKDEALFSVCAPGSSCSELSGCVENDY
ncbi:MAG: hypothetical protein ACE5HE_10895 [Phycisphaerae bacterium]